MRFYLKLFILFTFFGFLSCDKEKIEIISDEPEIRTIPLENISRITNNSGLDVVLKQGTEKTAVLQGKSSLLDLIDLRQENISLYIEMKDSAIVDKAEVQLTITIATLERLSVMNMGNILLLSEFKVPELTIEARGSGEVRTPFTLEAGKLTISRDQTSVLDLNVLLDDLFINSLQDGFIIIKGRAERASINIDGNSILKAADLTTRETNITHVSRGRAEVLALEKLSGAIKSKGDLYYRGDPEILVELEGSGKLIPY